jgi:catechol 2,3-dioxygenase
MLLRGINHIVLKVRSLAASDQFYREVLGLERVGQRQGMWFYKAGGHHHDLALVEVGDGAAAPGNTGRVRNQGRAETGLFHFCFDVADESALAELHRCCREAGVPVLGAVDHNIMRAFYVQDPDGHTVELGVDVPPAEWADPSHPFAADRPFDPEG